MHLPPEIPAHSEDAWWRRAQASPELGPGDVHVWRLRVDDPAAARSLRGLLSPDERERADRFRFERDAACFTLARAHLRQLLGRVVGVPATGIRFCYGAAGKPSLEREGAPSFSVSHSGEFALIALTAHGPIGVDVERIGRPGQGDPAAYFSDAEVRSWQSLPPDEQPRAFFRGWTRKEAYLKARGDGLGFGLRRFAVTLGPDEPPRLLWVQGEPEEPGRWDLRDLPVDPDYSAAIVAAAPLRGIFGWDLTAPR